MFLPDGRPDIIGFNASDDIEGEDDNTDLYVEASIPLLADRPGVRSLEAVVGYRYSDYASAGGADAYKAELLYRPVDALQAAQFVPACRAGAERVRALSAAVARAFFVFDIEPLDPCEADSDRAQRTGPGTGRGAVPGSRLPAPNSCRITTIRDDVARGFVGGNPDLDPETADTLTFGVVLTSPFASRWLDRLQVSLDWYRIEIDDAIVTVFADEFIARCFDRTFNPEFEASNQWCGMFSRDPTTGDIVDAYEILRNSEGLRTSGLDLQLDWRFDLGPGELGVNWLVAYLDSFEQLEASGIPPWSWLERRDVTRVSSGVRCPNGNGASA